MHLGPRKGATRQGRAARGFGEVAKQTWREKEVHLEILKTWERGSTRMMDGKWDIRSVQRGSGGKRQNERGGIHWGGEDGKRKKGI